MIAPIFISVFSEKQTLLRLCLIPIRQAIDKRRIVYLVYCAGAITFQSAVFCGDIVFLKCYHQYKHHQKAKTTLREKKPPHILLHTRILKAKPKAYCD